MTAAEDSSDDTNIREEGLPVWQSEQVIASLSRGLAEAAEGRTRRLDHLTEDIDDQ